MHVLAKRTLKAFWLVHPPARAPLEAWYAIVSKADWTRPTDVTDAFGAAADFVGDSRVIFDIGGNKYRLIGHFAFPYGRALIKFVGTHKDYDRINPETVT